MLTVEEYLNNKNVHAELNFISTSLSNLTDEVIRKTQKDDTAVLFIESHNDSGFAEQRCIFVKN